MVPRAATPELQKRFYERLLSCALQDSKPEVSASSELDFEPGMWQDFLRSTALEEDPVLASMHPSCHRNDQTKQIYRRVS